MSPAKKRKAAARSQRGGAKPRTKTRAARRPARTAGRKAAAVATVPCDMPASKLAAAFDRPEEAGPLLSHVPGCGACTTSLTVLAAAGQGLKHLTADGAGTGVERVLARGQAQGVRKFADLVYELVKACLVVVQEKDRRLQFDHFPRPKSVVDLEVNGALARLATASRHESHRLSNGDPTTDRAIVAAGSSIKILEQLEGPSERLRITRGVLLICSGRAAEAEEHLRTVLSDGATGANRRSALNNLTWALIRQRKTAEALEVGGRASREFPSSWVANYNLAVAAAWANEPALVRRCARKLLGLRTSQRVEADRRRAQLVREVPRFAEQLGQPLSAVAKWFGEPIDVVETNNEAR